MTFTPDYEQLKMMTKEQVQARIVELNADYHPAESKKDLIGRLLQLQGTAQPIDKIRKALEEHGIGEDGTNSSAVNIPKTMKRLTVDEMKKAMKPFIEKGMKFRVAKDLTTWEMQFVCEQLEQGGRILKANRLESGNTMMPLSVLVSRAVTITTVNTYRKKNINAGDGYVEVAAKEESGDEVAA